MAINKQTSKKSSPFCGKHFLYLTKREKEKRGKGKKKDTKRNVRSSRSRFFFLFIFMNQKNEKGIKTNDPEQR